MNQVTITRSQCPNLTNKQLKLKHAAYHELFGDPALLARTSKIWIVGQWPRAYKGDGLYLRVAEPALIVAIGREYIRVKYMNDEGKEEIVRLLLSPSHDTTEGWWEITFSTRK